MRVLEGIKELEGVPAVDNVDIPRPMAHNTTILQARLFLDGLLPESALRNPHLYFLIMEFFLPQPHEPAERKVVIHLLHQSSLGADAVKALQQQGTKEMLRGMEGQPRCE
jgi:hypothetical protein